jgi:hypothetical protein
MIGKVSSSFRRRNETKREKRERERGREMTTMFFLRT